MAKIDPSTDLKTMCNTMSVDDIEIDDNVKKAELKLEDLTTNVKVHKEGEFGDRDWYVTGDGWFDKLMETVTSHLKAQFEANRIREEDYAVAYTELTKHTMQLAVDAWLKKQEIEAQTEFLRVQALVQKALLKKVPYEIKKLAAETEHICEQTVHERIKERLTESQILLTDAQTEQVKEQTVHERLKENLTVAQTVETGEKTRNLAYTTDHVLPTNVVHVEAQTRLIDEQTTHERLKEAGTQAATAQVLETTVHEKLKEAQTKEQTALVVAQTSHEAKKQENTVASTAHTNAETTMLIPANTGHIVAQTDKTREEIKLIEPQIDKVEAETCKLSKECKDMIPAQVNLLNCQAKYYCNKSESENDELEAKKALYLRQIEGFDEKYKTDILKICADAWNVGFSVSKDTFDPSGEGDDIPMILQHATINDLYRNYILTDLDLFKYGRPKVPTDFQQPPK